MQEIRISSTQRQTNSLPKKSFLGEVFTQGNISVESTEDIQRFSRRNEEVLILGNIIGRRNFSGNYDTPYSINLNDYLFSQPLEKIRQELEGRYVLVKVDASSNIHICHDKFGAKDLFYKLEDNGFIISTSLDDFDLKSGVENYDQVGLASMLTIYGTRPAKKHTIYKNVRRLGVGEFFKIDSGAVSIEQTEFNPRNTYSFGERELNEYADTFLDSLKIRGSGDMNVVFLSSGWDSTSILSGLVKVFGKSKVKAVTGRLIYSERSGVLNEFEIKRAQEIADHYDVELKYVDFDYFQKGPEYLEEIKSTFKNKMFGALTGLNWKLLAKGAREIAGGNGVVFSGEISDGAHNLGFSQFLSIFHPDMNFREYSDKMLSYLFGPTFLRQLKDKRQDADFIFSSLKAKYGLGELETFGKSDTEITENLLKSFFLRPFRFPGAQLSSSSLLTNNGIEAYDKELMDYIKPVAGKLNEDNLYSGYLHLYNSFHWQGSTVATIPEMIESEGLKFALPFWDSNLQDILASMPENCGRGLDMNPTKYPLKWTLKNKIKDYPFHLQVGPHSYIYDVEEGFNLAEELLFSSSFTDYFKKQLKSGSYREVFSSDYFNVSYMDQIVKKYISNEELSAAERSDILNLLMFETYGDLARTH